MKTHKHRNDRPSPQILYPVHDMQNALYLVMAPFPGVTIVLGQYLDRGRGIKEVLTEKIELDTHLEDEGGVHR